MSKLLSILVAAIFAAVTLSAVAAESAAPTTTTKTEASQPGNADKKTEKKEVVLKGLVACNKCELGKSTQCETVLVVKDEKKKKDIVYFFDKDSHAKFHDDICSAAKNGTVTGFVKDVDKKKVISVKKVTYD